MVELIMSVILAFGITFYAIPAIIHAAQEKKLFDYPDERKLHRQPVPALGGIGIFSGFVTAFLLTASFTEFPVKFQYLIAAALVIFFVGLKDDLLNISPFKKFLGQVLAAAIIAFKGGLLLTSMDGFLGVNELPDMASYLLTILTIVVIINAYNLIDGVDGLATGLSLISSSFFAVFFFINDDIAYACMATSLIGALLAFLIFNAQPARIFMGDTGSMMLGLLHAMMVIRFIGMAESAPIFPVSAAPAVGFAILFVPLFDTLRVFSFRMLRGTSPFTPDRNHIHHILLRFRFSHTQVALMLGFAGLAVPVVTYFMRGLGTAWLLTGLIFVGFFVAGILLLRYRFVTKSNVVKGSLGEKMTAIRPISMVERKASGQN
ncbi:MAG: undecaprenyl/decaprenyl-phosphate alpha-N-acetylglucosaminyl 1-phosphate transferase [Chitinophagaceae bacterium]|jgi:UDP-N-acetylmuramyl pentapeptide phosphotransferase/UDP-N-acetylglucosamine-1-phosphate transferase|nr:undecaprenyl/decaprenyl-phosphate alpha-N-acetylglucosaminyl 1-phosphate transferase [Chitinophagaceae bacterium]